MHGFDENGDSKNNDIAALECDITEGEVYEAIRMLKHGKAAGPDLIIGDFSKLCYTCCPVFSPIL